MNITCVFQDKSKFTVGEKVSLVCEGSFDFFSNLTVEFTNPEHKYALKILDASLLSNQQLVLTVTGYKVGGYQNISFQIKNGAQVYQVENLSWTIETVLKNTDQNTHKKIQPYPPYGPWLPDVAPVYIGSFALVLLLAVGFVIYQIRKVIKRKRFRKEIHHRLGGKTPLECFIKQMTPYMTQAESEKDVTQSILELSQILDEFLENKFEVPIELSLKQRVKRIKSKKVHKNSDVINTLSELEVLKKDPSRYTKKDVEQMVEEIRSWVFSQGED